MTEETLVAGKKPSVDADLYAACHACLMEPDPFKKADKTQALFQQHASMTRLNLSLIHI